MGYRLYKSVIAGATGRAGQALARQLLLSPLCQEVHAVTRQRLGAFNELAAAAKLQQHLATDFKELGGPLGISTSGL